MTEIQSRCRYNGIVQHSSMKDAYSRFNEGMYDGFKISYGDDPNHHRWIWVSKTKKWEDRPIFIETYYNPDNDKVTTAVSDSIKESLTDGEFRSKFDLVTVP